MINNIDSVVDGEESEGDSDDDSEEAEEDVEQEEEEDGSVDEESDEDDEISGIYMVSYILFIVFVFNIWDFGSRKLKWSELHKPEFVICQKSNPFTQPTNTVVHKPHMSCRAAMNHFAIWHVTLLLIDYGLVS